jgi:hypothetical protein
MPCSLTDTVSEQLPTSIFSVLINHVGRNSELEGGTNIEAKCKRMRLVHIEWEPVALKGLEHLGRKNVIVNKWEEFK